MKRCFGYIRVSTVKQGDGVSLDSQRQAIEIFAQRNDIVICRWFEEKVTAAKSGRPMFNTMVRSLLRREADGFVVHKIDRSARNFADWAKIGELSDAGIDVHFVTETLDFRSRGGRLTADIQAVIAADYVRNLRDECLKGLYGRLQQGYWPWPAPLGYRNNGGGRAKTLDPRTAPLIKEMFELYATGNYSIRTLRGVMAERGLRNKRGRPLAEHCVERALANPFYCGILSVGGGRTTYSGVHEPLISVSQFRSVQSIKAGKYGKKTTRHSHTYRGLFRCAKCNCMLVGERQKRHVYYRCHSYGCKGVSIREADIEAGVSTLLRTIRFDHAMLATIERDLFAPKHRSADEDGEQLKLALAQIEARLAALIDALVDRLIDQSAYAMRRETLLLDRQALLLRIKRLEGVDDDPKNVAQFLELAKNLARNYETAESSDRRQIVFLATSNRVVSGKSLLIEPEDWLRCFQNDLGIAFGGPQRSGTRSAERTSSTPMQIEKELPDLRRRLTDAAASKEAQDMQKLVMQMNRPKLAAPKNDGRF